MKKRILVPNGNYTDIRLIQAFKKMGFYVITSGNSPELEGHKYADEYAPHDYSDHVGMLELAKKLDIDYVSACSNDFGVTTAAYIAENLGLPGHDTFQNARIIAEKDLFKRFAMENGIMAIPSHWFEDREAAIEFAGNSSYPLIVKPTDLGGGKGVSLIRDPSETADAVGRAFDISRHGHVVIEPFIEGTQHSITTFLIDQKVVSWITFNEYEAQNYPFLVGYSTSPADDMPRIGEILIGQIEKMASILHLADGVFHVQYIVRDGVPQIMECMRRCLGNYALKAASIEGGLEWEEWIARAYCGFDCSDIPRCICGEKLIAEYYIQAPRNGVLDKIVTDPAIEKYIIDRESRWYEGMKIDAYEKEMLDFVFFQFPTVRERDEIARDFGRYFTVVMK